MSEQTLGGNYNPLQQSVEDQLREHTDELIKVGDLVVYHDTLGNPHNALITAGWGSRKNNPCINLLFVSSDSNKVDQYGRQIERESSVSHGSLSGAFGRYWRWPNEKANERTSADIK